MRMGQALAEGPITPRKEEILDHATRLFAERGYEGTSMNDVAERVGMRKASLFYHFATKDALYEAALNRLLRQVHDPLVSPVYAGEGSFVERAVRASEIVTAVCASQPCAARLLLREMMDWGPLMRGELAGNVVDVFEAGTAFIRAGQEAGDFVEGDPKQIVLTLASMHLVPFALCQFVERFTGGYPFDPRIVAARTEALRRQVRDLLARPRRQ